MNLKEAFRYQNWLSECMAEASRTIGLRSNAVKTVKAHKRHAANPEAEDITETVDKSEGYNPMDVLTLMDFLILQREKLCKAIADAKASLCDPSGTTFDMDTALDAVKFRRNAANGIKLLLVHKGGKSVDRGTDYKFNAEGNQTPYYYEVETTIIEDFDRNTCKATMKKLLADADALSAAIERAQVEADVNYTPLFDVNETFDDIMAQIVTNKAA